MADLKVEVTDFLPEFANLAKNVDFKTTFPNTLAALNIAAHKILVQWRKAATGEQLPGMPYPIWSRAGGYADSISIDAGDSDTKSVYSRGPNTDRIERGHGEIDLKPGLLHGPKSRMGKRGPYNIVSFRHGTPNTLPSNRPMESDTYNLIQRETNKAETAYKKSRTGRPGISRVTGTTEQWVQTNAGGKSSSQKRQVRSYKWGYRIPASKGGAVRTKKTSRGDYTWKTGKSTGMTRLQAGAGRTHQYRTFRVVSINSDPASWIVPALDANPIRQAVVDATREEIMAILKMAMEEDLK